MNQWHCSTAANTITTITACRISSNGSSIISGTAAEGIGINRHWEVVSFRIVPTTDILCIRSCDVMERTNERTKPEEEDEEEEETIEQLGGLERCRRTSPTSPSSSACTSRRWIPLMGLLPPLFWTSAPLPSVRLATCARDNVETAAPDRTPGGETDSCGVMDRACGVVTSLWWCDVIPQWEAG